VLKNLHIFIGILILIVSLCPILVIWSQVCIVHSEYKSVCIIRNYSLNIGNRALVVQ